VLVLFGWQVNPLTRFVGRSYMGEEFTNFSNCHVSYRGIHNFGDLKQMEILSRLPVKCQERFRCVCKSYYTLITNLDFITKHLTSHNLHRGTILHRHDWDGLGQLRVSTLSNETLELSGDVDLLQLIERRRILRRAVAIRMGCKRGVFCSPLIN
jgi:hypothetical protein